MHDFSVRPSPLAVFLTRIGIKKDEGKPTTASVSPQKYINTMSSETPHTAPQPHSRDPRGAADSAISPLAYQPSPVKKAKRRSSPFLRIVHRLSMNRKTGRKGSGEITPTYGPEFGGSAEEVNVSACSSTCSQSPEASPRPAWSENDLRHITIRTQKVPIEEITPLKGVNTFCSEDNLVCGTPGSASGSRRSPSYLRVSCALNGYRGYRRLNDTPVSNHRSPTAFPMSIVESRTLAYQNALSPTGGFSTPSSKKETMMEAMLNTPTPVRQLVARFDNLHISSASKSCEEVSAHDKSIDSGAGGSSDGQMSPLGVSQLIEECSALPISATLHSSIPLSGQTLDKALSQPTPEPELAHAVHSGLRQSTVLNCQPHEKNQSEVVVSELQVRDAEVARKVSSEDSANLLSGEHFRKLFIKSRDSLQKRATEASEFLNNGEEIPEIAADALRLAVGKANLLMSKKLKTFEELIEKNLRPIEGDTQPAKIDDLSAYWDLVRMEISDVERLFSDVDVLQKNGWQCTAASDGDATGSSKPPTLAESSPLKGARKVRAMPPSRPRETGKNAAAEKQRREALAEAKRKLRERMQKEGNAPDSLIL